MPGAGPLPRPPPHPVQLSAYNHRDPKIRSELSIEVQRQFRGGSKSQDEASGGSATSGLVGRATHDTMARRPPQTLRAWAEANGSIPAAARLVGVSRRTAERDLRRLVERRPMYPSPRAFELEKQLLSNFAQIEQSPWNRGIPAQVSLARDPDFESLCELLALTRAPDVKPFSFDEVVQPDHDVISRVERTLRFHEEPESVFASIRNAACQFGSPTEIPRSLRRGERDARILLLYGSTPYTQSDIAEAFALSERQVLRILRRAEAKFPDVAESSLKIRGCLQVWEAQSYSWQQTASENPLFSRAAQLAFLNLRWRTLRYLGALPSRSHYSYLARRERLLASVASACDEGNVKSACRERLASIVSAWSEGKKMPAAVPPLPEGSRHKMPEKCLLF